MKLTSLNTFLVLMFIFIGGCSLQSSRVNEANLTGLKFRIETTSMEESMDFYSKYLGLTVVEQWNDEDDQGAILGLYGHVDGQAFLELGFSKTLKSYQGVSIQIRVNSLTEIMDKVHGKIEFSEPVERPWGSRYLYLTDPNGVTVILYEGKI